METIPYDTLLKQEAEITVQLNAVREYIKAFYPGKLNLEERERTDMIVNQTALFEKIIPVEQKATKPKIVRKPIKKAAKSKVTVPTKVLTALQAIGEGKTKDVAEKMIELYPEYQKDKEKATKDARYYISALKDDKIEVVEEGIGNSGSTYRIKAA